MIRFVDGKTVVTENKKNLQRVLKTMEQTLKNELNIKINTKKTYNLVCSRNNNIKINIQRCHNTKNE